ncbi:Chromosome (plasmid) partitioning protein ParB / Stage 0 sporulation protein J [Thermobrachium celere DSM 8682]|uniref:Chromosome (Plasmid) partitioning protein ParB / Stage 0 sporulation protein J n=1 Tax=Thermobrachium celere DSM 8682 TaxID=941824 RepID=R7RUB8_9CLOT|nr:Chromosome (plasmid) partitioning protein ParB / Stage 0 sporulation protein J [Thermobrachium celere DSM 8682]
MSAKKSALGRGLGALIPEVEKNETEGIKEVDINDIFPNEEQPRKNIDNEKIEQLAQSIKEHGIIQPIIVKKDGDFYKIIAGERRWRAARLAGLKKVPIIEKEISEKEAMEISLIENIQREDLNPIEEALAYKKLIDEFGLTQEELANRLGKSRPAITNSLRLLSLDKRVIDMILNQDITEGHGKIIAGIDDKDKQYEIAIKVVNEGLNVRQTEKLIQSINVIKDKKEKSNTKDIYIKDIEERLKNIFGTKVSINKGRKRVKLR